MLKAYLWTAAAQFIIFTQAVGCTFSLSALLALASLVPTYFMVEHVRTTTRKLVLDEEAGRVPKTVRRAYFSSTSCEGIDQ